MKPDICPSCVRVTPEDRKICPYCPWDVVKWQLLGAVGAYAAVFVPLIVTIAALWWWGWS